MAVIACPVSPWLRGGRPALAVVACSITLCLRGERPSPGSGRLFDQVLPARWVPCARGVRLPDRSLLTKLVISFIDGRGGGISSASGYDFGTTGVELRPGAARRRVTFFCFAKRV